MTIEALEEVAGLLETKGIDYWVTGGYAVDLAVNRITREHKNVDFLIRVEDAGKVRRIVEKEGYVVDYLGDKMVARKRGLIVNFMTVDNFKGKHVVSAINVDVHLPKSLLNKPAIGLLNSKEYKRIPNELLYLFMRYSHNDSDLMIVKNLSVDKKVLKSIKVVLKPR
jgi:hypothetical protein